jgi:hypothetical protein
MFHSLLLAGAALLAGATAGHAQSASPAAAPVQAIRKEQVLSFNFQSFTTFYSCSSLESKVKRILEAVGAGPEIKLRTRGCLNPYEIASIPHVEIKLVSLVEATPEVLAELDKNRARRELIARARGDMRLVAMEEEQLPAQWKEVSLSRAKLFLDPGDCELVEQMRDKVFPKLAIKIVADEIRCSRQRASLGQPKLVVQALFPATSPDQI